MEGKEGAYKLGAEPLELDHVWCQEDILVPSYQFGILLHKEEPILVTARNAQHRVLLAGQSQRSGRAYSVKNERDPVLFGGLNDFLCSRQDMGILA